MASLLLYSGGDYTIMGNYFQDLRISGRDFRDRPKAPIKIGRR
jgi:hypothetical protein